MCESEQRVMASIPKLHKRIAMDILMFGFIEGMKAALPSMTVKDCLIMFQKKNNLSETEFPLDSARVTYQRMLKESWAYCKSEDK